MRMSGRIKGPEPGQVPTCTFEVSSGAFIARLIEWKDLKCGYYLLFVREEVSFQI